MEQQKSGESQLLKGAPIEPGTVIDGRYRISRLLGQGGMSTVYEAEQVALNRQVALKLMNPQRVVSAEAVKRFRREAELAATLKHPNIVTTYGFGVADGQPYITLELLTGQTLEAKIEQEGPLPLEKALPIFGQILDGLQYAHLQFVVHRDLKPSNVVIEPDGSARLLDFGIARLMAESDKEVQKLTQTGQVYGSFHYMSPERWQGSEVDHRSDLYSFGCLMHRVLTGQLPFDADSVYAIVAMHQRDTMPPIPNAPPHIVAIRDWCLNKDPGQRPQSASELKAALFSGSRPRPASPKRKNKFRSKAIFVSALTVFFTSIGYAVVFFNETRPDISAVKPVPDAHETALLDNFHRSQESARADRVAQSAYELCKYYLDKNSYKEADKFGRIATENYQRAGALSSPESMTALYLAAKAAQICGNYDRANALYMRLSEDTPMVTERLHCLALAGSAQCIAVGEDIQRANRFYQRAIKMCAVLEFSEKQELLLSYAQFLIKEDWDNLNANRKQRARDILTGIVQAGAHSKEDNARIELAKQLLNELTAKGFAP